MVINSSIEKAKKPTTNDYFFIKKNKIENMKKTKYLSEKSQ